MVLSIWRAVFLGNGVGYRVDPVLGMQNWVLANTDSAIFSSNTDCIVNINLRDSVIY